jgi:hypothetical protein
MVEGRFVGMVGVNPISKVAGIRWFVIPEMG